MFCEKCGNNCLDTQRFCNKCGAQLPVTPSAPVHEAPIPVPAPIVEPPAPEAFAFAPAPAQEAPAPIPAPVVETPAPIPTPAPAPKTAVHQRAPLPMLTYLEPQKKASLGIGKWLCVLLLSFLPLLVSYLLIFIDGTGAFDRIIINGGTSTLAIVLLAVIGAALVTQITFLMVYAFGKKHDPTVRNYALAFIIIAVAITVVLALADIGMQTFADTKPFEFVTSYVSPVGFVYVLFMSL